MSHFFIEMYCDLSQSMINARDPRKRESHLSIDQNGADFVLRIRLECHKVAN